MWLTIVHTTTAPRVSITTKATFRATLATARLFLTPTALFLFLLPLFLLLFPAFLTFNFIEFLPRLFMLAELGRKAISIPDVGHAGRRIVFTT